MGGVKSACLKPRSAPKDHEEVRGPSENDEKQQQRALTVLTSPEVSNAKSTTTTKMMKNGDAVLDVEKPRGEKQKKKRRKKRELSHAFQLPAFQSQDDNSNDASKTTPSMHSSEG